jgi:hypothetical protein
MGWSVSIADKRAQAQHRVSLALRIRKNTNGGGVGEDFLASSVPAHNPDAVLLPDTYQGQGDVLTVQTWRIQPGHFTIALHFPSRLSDRAALASRSLRRGALCELLEGEGADLGTYVARRRGRIQQITWPDVNVCQVVVYSLLYSLKSRPYPVWDGSGNPNTKLFQGVCGVETTSTTAFTGNSSTTLTLTDASTFVTFNGTGVAKITPDVGNPFYVTFTGKSGNQLTGIATTNKFNTTQANAAIGNTVQSVAYLGAAHPLVIARRVLVSTGNGTNGTEDVYPETAGFGLDVEWIDEAQFRLVRGTVMNVSPYAWDVLVESPQQDGIGWLQGLLQPVGAFLVERQGQIAPRCAQDLSNAQPCGQDQTITNADIEGQPTGEWYDPQVPYAYNRLQFTGSGFNGVSEESVTTLPVRDELVWDLSDRMFANQLNIHVNTLSRCELYAHHIGEVIRMTLSGTWWGLCAGDVIPLTTDRCRGRFVSTYGGYDQRTVVVLSANERIIEPFTDVVLLSMPIDAEDDYST